MCTRVRSNSLGKPSGVFVFLLFYCYLFLMNFTGAHSRANTLLRSVMEILLRILIPERSQSQPFIFYGYFFFFSSKLPFMPSLHQINTFRSSERSLGHDLCIFRLSWFLGRYNVQSCYGSFLRENPHQHCVCILECPTYDGILILRFSPTKGACAPLTSMSCHKSCLNGNLAHFYRG